MMHIDDNFTGCLELTLCKCCYGHRKYCDTCTCDPEDHPEGLIYPTITWDDKLVSVLRYFESPPVYGDTKCDGCGTHVEGNRHRALLLIEEWNGE